MSAENSRRRARDEVEDSAEKEEVPAKKKKDDARFRYGNFSRYYGHRLEPGQSDPRLEAIDKNWVARKSVLDIGCNVGYLTLSLARDFEPRRIVGIDIDEHLIGVARKNIRHYCNKTTKFVGKFPASFADNSVNPPTGFSTKFPDNIWFRKENYVLDSDEMLDMIEEEFDVILALSITKWVHLNFGDDGLRRFFRRAHKQLMPGGRFILEPQGFETYRKRAKGIPELWSNYKAIQFKPDEFTEFLTNDVGFDRVETLPLPAAKSKGFERPLQVFYKKGPQSHSASKSSESVPTQRNQ